MPRETRAAAHANASDSLVAGAALADLYALLASGENVDGSQFSLPVADAGLRPLGYAQVAFNGSAGAAVLLPNVPTGSRLVLMSASVAARWRDDGTAPTALVGFPLAATTPFRYESSGTAFRIISQGATGGNLDVCYYGV